MTREHRAWKMLIRRLNYLNSFGGNRNEMEKTTRIVAKIWDDTGHDELGGVMEKTELESELLNAQEHIDNIEFLLRQKNEKISQLEAKAEAYDKLMSGGKKTLQEVANFFGVPMEWTGREVMFRIGEHTLTKSMENFIELPDTPYVLRFEPKKEATDND